MTEDLSPLDKLAEPVSAAAREVANAAAGGVLAGIQESSTELRAALVGDKLKLWRLKNWVSAPRAIRRDMLVETSVKLLLDCHSRPVC